MSGRDRITLAGVVATVLVLAAVSGWYWWPREVAPGLTPQMVAAIDRGGSAVTVIGGGSRRDAHELWARYHHRWPGGEPPRSPRLLGISLVTGRTHHIPSGTYWVVYSDRVWNPSFGPDGSGSSFSQEVVFVDPSSLRAVATRWFGSSEFRSTSSPSA